METKRVTAIITTYQRDAKTVERALNSVLEQSYPIAEILIVDDNPDDSPRCREIQTLCRHHPSVIYIKQGGNQGACAARNLGIRNSTGEFIGFLDDDDTWLPDKIQLQIQAFEDNEDSLGMVFCSGFQVDEMTGEKTDYYNCKSSRTVSLEKLLGFDLVGTTSNPLIRRKCFDRVGGFWEEQPARQDYEMWLRIAKEYQIVGIEGRHFVYTLHSDDQITKDLQKSYTGFRNIYVRHKEDYKKYPRARINILNCIIRNRTRIDIEVLLLGIERQWLQMRYRLPRNEW